MGFHAFHKLHFPPSLIRLCVAEFMTRFALSKSRTYVHWGTGERELYLRPQDPYENENAYDPANPPALADRLDALVGCAGDSCRAAEDGPNRTGGVK